MGACVNDEIQDVDAAEDEKTRRTRKIELEATRWAQRGNLRTSSDPKVTIENALKDKPWRKKIHGGHRLRFVLD